MTGWLVTGAGGMLGRDLVEVLADRAAAGPGGGRAAADPGSGPAAADPGGAAWVTALSRADLDITDPAAVKAAVAGHDVVVNAAAWTDVDGAEAAEAAATAVNGHGVAHLAEACAAAGARLLHVSTDYVFDGTAGGPYREDAATAPGNAYGRGKLAGERAVARLLPGTGYVVRTAWLYGAHGPNFVRTMLRLAAERDTVDVVADQCGQPTWTRALAGRLLALGDAALAGRAPAGVYHGTASGETTWYGLARAVFELSGLDPDRVRPISSAEFARLRPAAARRPANSVLGHGRWAAAGLPPLPPWRAMLAEALTRGGFG